MHGSRSKGSHGPPQILSQLIGDLRILNPRNVVRVIGLLRYMGLFQNDVRLGLMAAGGEDDGSAQDERPADPGVGPEMLPQQLDAEP